MTLQAHYIDTDLLQTPHAMPLPEAFADEPDYLLPYEGPICCECGFPCETKPEDQSFTHEFGVEVRKAVVSDCCGADVEEER